MKCVQSAIRTNKSPNSIIRVDDYKAEQMVKSGNWFYCSKKLWKETGRNYK